MEVRVRDTSRKSTLVAVLGLAIAAAVMLPGPARATITADTSGDTLVVSGDAGANTIILDWDEFQPDLIFVKTPLGSEPVSAGGSCVAGADLPRRVSEIRCPLAGVRRVSVSTGDGDDSVGVAPSRSDETLLDVLFPIPTLIIGGNGDDDLQAGGWHGRAFGEAGDDALYGRLGPTRLSGGTGNDVLTDGDGGNDRLDGGPQGDVLQSTGGRDVLIGDSGRDVMRAGTGRDRIFADDGTRDKQVRCGPTRGDVAFVDSSDPGPQLCERVFRTP
jgi:Ca2+-binding RTX toxin-like protein